MLSTEFLEQSLDTTFSYFTGEERVADVLGIMLNKRLECAPVLHDNKITAMVTLPDLLSADGLHTTNPFLLRELQLQKAESITLDGHYFDIFSQLRLFPHALIPVSDKEGDYIGVIEKSLLCEHIAKIFHLGDEGGTIELEVPSFNLKLSEVIAALEKNDATVLGFGMYPTASSSNTMILTFRLQTHDLFRLVKNLEKYGYLVRYTSPFFKEKEDELREKALEFIRLMDM